MFVFFFPYNTDAPIYYRPITTIAMIVINIIVFAVTLDCSREEIEPFLLAVGSGLHPIQWLTNNFLHEGFFHLLGNMIFLWAFGLVVEGKLGNVKMFFVYIGIGILYGATVQVLMLGHEPGHCLGASAIISGLMVMGLVWAPENSIDCLLIVWILHIFRSGYFEVRIIVLVGLFVLLDGGWLFFSGGDLSTELLHTIGAIIGLIVGIFMLTMNWVDCEHWDIFSVWKGENLLSDEERAEIEANKPEAVKRRAEKRQKRLQNLIEEIELAIQNQTPLPAYVIAQKMEHEFSDWKLPQPLHLTLIQQLLGGKHWTEAAVSMRQYLSRHIEQTVFVRLMLAQTFIAQNRPKQALNVLNEIVFSETESAQQLAVQKIRAKAETLYRDNLEQGCYELGE